MFWVIYIHKSNLSTFLHCASKWHTKLRKIDIICNKGGLFVCQIGTLFYRMVQII
jgi:hypothetical protein